MQLPKTEVITVASRVIRVQLSHATQQSVLYILQHAFMLPLEVVGPAGPLYVAVAARLQSESVLVGDSGDGGRVQQLWSSLRLDFKLCDHHDVSLFSPCSCSRFWQF